MPSFRGHLKRPPVLEFLELVSWQKPNPISVDEKGRNTIGLFLKQRVRLISQSARDSTLALPDPGPAANGISMERGPGTRICNPQFCQVACALPLPIG